MPNEIHVEMVQAKGAAYRASRIHPRSYYLDPVDQSEGRLAGHSRIWGDASPEVQSSAINALVEASRKAGLGARDTAHVLAIARIESGFDPDAAAGTTTASGLGQFIKDTGKAYGLDDANRFDVDAQADALVAHFVDNRALAQRRGQDESYIYKYHHDGPSLDYGGLALSRTKVMPMLEDYTRFVEQRFGINRSNGTGPSLDNAASRSGSGAPGRAGLLRDGQRGSSVAELQAALAGLGFTDARNGPLQADGTFGPRTGEAVQAFQQATGLPVDGIAGSGTREALGRAQQLRSEASRHAGPVSASPIETLLAAAESGDPATFRAALDDFTESPFGQMFQREQIVPAQEIDRSTQIETQSQWGPGR